MAGGLKAIKRRLVSVKNTKQITRAMKLVSAAKLNRAQNAVTRAREYSSALNTMFDELQATVASGNQGSNSVHPLMEVRSEVKTIRFVVVGGSRGLCGGYNTNVNKQVESAIREATVQYPEAVHEFVLVGRKPAEYFRRVGRPFNQAFEKPAEDPNLWPIVEIAQALSTDFKAGKIDRAYLIFTAFKSVVSLQPTCNQILPFPSQDTASQVSAVAQGTDIPKAPKSGLTIFEPSAEAVFADLIPRLVQVKIRQACLEAKVSEHASRMTAMDSATKNASELIEKLQLQHNRLRQSGITSELLDIVGGAEAIN